VLDLVLADEGNPRGLAFQLAAIGQLLTEIAGPTDQSLVNAVAVLRNDVEVMLHDVTHASDQARAALVLPDRLRTARDAVADLSDRLSRRYFAVLSTARTGGVDTPDQELRGAA
jgi:uncharacterized alpha-E superfamily protein